jgi:hypothetical protein
MMVPNELQEYSICSMYRDGVNLHRLEIAFDRTEEELVEVLRRQGIVQPRPGEDRATFVSRVRSEATDHAA